MNRKKRREHFKKLAKNGELKNYTIPEMLQANEILKNEGKPKTRINTRQAEFISKLNQGKIPKPDYTREAYQKLVERKQTKISSPLKDK